jgi:hypothetical protein
MEVQAIQQGTCTECDTNSDNWRVVQRDFSSHGVDRLLSCECGARAAVRIGPEGLTARGRVSHAEASWEDNDE